MDTENLAAVIWRIVGGTFIIYGIITAIVQFVAVSSTFGQFMESESLYEGTALLSILLWPIVLVVAGLILILFSRVLARQVIRGLSGSSSPHE